MGKSKKGDGEKQPDKTAPGSQRLGSRQWSCSELKDGSEQLLGAKQEVDEEAEKTIEDPCDLIKCFHVGIH